MGGEKVAQTHEPRVPLEVRPDVAQGTRHELDVDRISANGRLKAECPERLQIALQRHQIEPLAESIVGPGASAAQREEESDQPIDLRASDRSLTAVEQTYLKQYCSLIHGQVVIDATLALRDEHAIAATDVASVKGRAVFVLRLADRHVIEITQTVWDTLTNTLHAFPAEALDEHTRYAIVVTRSVKDAAGNAIEPGDGPLHVDPASITADLGHRYKLLTVMFRMFGVAAYNDPVIYLLREVKRPGKVRFEFTTQGVTSVFARSLPPRPEVVES